MTISSIAPARGKDRFLIGLDDGAILRVGLGELADFSLHVGMELGAETLALLLAAASKAAARDRALALVSHRPYARAELVRKLMEKKVASEDADEAAQWACQIGLLNDAQYARDLARRYAGRGYGIYKIKSEFLARAVPKELWEDALDACGDPAEAIDSFLRRAFGGSTPDRKQMKRAADALARRGFTWREIGEGLRRCGADAE